MSEVEPIRRISSSDVDVATASFGSLDPIEGSFAAAVRASVGVISQTYRLAEHVVQLVSPNKEMLDKLTRTFTHLRTRSAATPDLTVHLWDSSSRKTLLPPLPEVAEETAPGAFFYYNDERVRMGFQLGTSGDARVLAVYPHLPTPALSVLSVNTGRAWYWVEDAERIPYWEQATPLVYLLHWWLRERGLHLVHAGAVGTADGGAILVGKSGSGKSTATLTALQSDELQYAGDDYVAIQLEPAPFVHGFYSAGKLMANHVERLPFLLSALSNTDQLDVEKAVVYVHEHWPQQITKGFPLRAILVPRIAPGALQARVELLPRLAALAAMAPSTVFQMHTRGQDSLSHMRKLAELVPSYRLELGSDMSSIPRVIVDLLRQLAEESAG